MNMRIVYFGTPDIAAGALELVLAAGHRPVAVVVQPDKTRGRDRREVSAAPVKDLALQAGLPVLQPESCKDAAFLDELAAFKADVFAVVAFGQLLPQRLLDLPRLGAFNAHASLLPRWRGSAPINWAILNGDAQSGMCIQRMRMKLDSGPIVWRRVLDLAPKETAETLRARLTPLAAEGLLATFAALEAGTLREDEQDETQVTLAPKLSKEQGLVDWTRSAAEIERAIRGLAPWPGVQTRFEGAVIKLHAAETSLIAIPATARPGEVLSADTQGIVVATGHGALTLLALQREGKKRLDAAAFCCGCRLVPGVRLGS